MARNKCPLGTFKSCGNECAWFSEEEQGCVVYIGVTKIVPVLEQVIDLMSTVEKTNEQVLKTLDKASSTVKTASKTVKKVVTTNGGTKKNTSKKGKK